jgi:hypothetical protein
VEGWRRENEDTRGAMVRWEWADADWNRMMLAGDGDGVK